MYRQCSNISTTQQLSHKVMYVYLYVCVSQNCISKSKYNFPKITYGVWAPDNTIDASRLQKFHFKYTLAKLRKNMLSPHPFWAYACFFTKSFSDSSILFAHMCFSEPFLSLVKLHAFNHSLKVALVPNYPWHW